MNILYENFNSKIDLYPYPHTEYKLYSDDLNDKLIQNFQLIKKYFTKNKKLSESRVKLDLLGDNINGIQFKEYNFLARIEPLNSVLQEFSKNISVKLYNKYNSIPKKKISYKIMLVYDIKNYSIGPHTDNYNRNSTLVSYLVPKKDLDKKLGLHIYKDKINRHKNEWLSKHYSFEDFENVKQIEYYPGSTIDFKVGKESFHGVQPIKEICDRMSIQFFVFN